jgi:hypothetical protein
MRKLPGRFVFVSALLALLVLVLSGGQLQAQKGGDLPDLPNYLKAYNVSPTVATGKELGTKTDHVVAKTPPTSSFSTRTAPVVRVMPPSQQATSMDQKPDAPYTWPGRPLVVWGRVDGGTAPYTFKLEYGDGSPADSGNVDGSPGRKANYIAVAHVYTTAGPKLARLTVTDAGQQVAWGDIQIYVEPFTGNEREHDLLLHRNAAIQDGLRWLYLQQLSGGSWYVDHYYWNYDNHATTAVAVSAFEMQGYYANDDPATHIYAEFIRMGLESVFSGLVQQPIAVQPWGNPDSDGDGYGLHSDTWSGTYVQGLVMYAIALSREPNAVAQTGGAGVLGLTYREILVDLVDNLAWSQGDGNWNEGGWRYNTFTENDESDNSAVQWATIGLDAAARPENDFRVQAPAFVKSELQKWLIYSRGGDGSYGYTGPYGNVGLTASGMFSEYYCGRNINMTDPANDPLILASRGYIQSYWCDTYYYQGMFGGHFYSMYAVKKALDDMKIAYLDPLQTIDWYADCAHFFLKGYASPCVSDAFHQVVELTDPGLVNLEGDGYWPADNYVVNNPIPATCFGILVLAPGISCDVYAEGNSSPSSVCPGVSVSFDGGNSHSTCQDRQIAEWRWDFDDRDGADIDDPDATGPTVVKADGYTLALGDPADTVQATLWAIDDGVPPYTAVSKVPVVVTRINHSPLAGLNGPFTACVGEPIHLNGGSSFDPDDGAPCGPDSVALYEWDIGGDGSIDFTSTTCQPDTSLVYYDERTLSIILWVTDTRGMRSAQAAADLIWSSFRDLHVAVGDIVFDPPSPWCGADLQICATIHATVRGGAPPIAETVVRIYHDEYVPQNPEQNLICEKILVDLEDGMAVPVCCDWNALSPAPIIVVTDANQQIQECVETDNIASAQIECASGVTDGETKGPALFEIQAIRPNPTSARTEIFFRVPAEGPVALSIFDAGGRLVRSLEQRSYAPGSHVTSWDGLGNDGQRVSVGVYFIHGESAGVRVEKQVVVVQ